MSRVVQTYMRAMIILLGGMFAATAFAKATTELDDVSRKEIAERLAPAGSVCEIGQPCADNIGAVIAKNDGPRSGEQVFNQSCTACHTIGVLNAPKKGDTATWTARMNAAGGFDKLLANAIKGVGSSMPPKGTCMDCSDEELQGAIEYMSGLKP